MTKAENNLRAAGTTLAIGGLLLAAGLVLHGPPQSTPTDQMHAIGDGATWAPVHWVAAISLMLFAVAGLVVLTADSRLTSTPSKTIAWAAIPVGALLTMTTAIAEATVIAQAAAADDEAIFTAWLTFAEGMANGFAILALAVAAIAAGEARAANGTMPAWATWVGAGVAFASFGGWALGSWVGIEPAALLWVGASLLMCLWLVWFGVALTRADTAAAAQLSMARS